MNEHSIRRSKSSPVAPGASRNGSGLKWRAEGPIVKFTCDKASHFIEAGDLMLLMPQLLNYPTASSCFCYAARLLSSTITAIGLASNCTDARKPVLIVGFVAFATRNLTPLKAPSCHRKPSKSVPRPRKEEPSAKTSQNIKKKKESVPSCSYY